MAPRINPGDFRSSSLSEGRCFVYVFPCAYEDILKLGFSRDPIGRLQALHHRYFDFFDLDRAFLIQTETVLDARRLESSLGRSIDLHNAPAPLVIRREAAGHTEWYRGACNQLAMAAQELSADGYLLHQPIRPWVRQNLIARSDRLFFWSSEMLNAIVSDPHIDEATRAAQCTLRDALDACTALDIDLEPMVSDTVLRWHRTVSGKSLDTGNT